MTLKIRTPLPVVASVTAFNPLSTASKSGALSPTFSSGPRTVRGLPFKVVAADLSIAAILATRRARTHWSLEDCSKIFADVGAKSAVAGTEKSYLQISSGLGPTFGV